MSNEEILRIFKERLESVIKIGWDAVREHSYPTVQEQPPDGLNRSQRRALERENKKKRGKR